MVVTVLAVVGPSAFVGLLILTPNSIEINVTDASLNLTANNTPHYNLALNISISNPNKRNIGLYYHTIQATGYYYNYKFGTVSLTPFYQGHKNTSVLSPVLHGQQLSFLGTSSELISKFNWETGNGVYSIDVYLNLKIRAKVGRWIKIGHFEPVIMCGLMVPLTSNGRSIVSFFPIKCELDH